MLDNNTVLTLFAMLKHTLYKTSVLINKVHYLSLH